MPVFPLSTLQVGSATINGGTAVPLTINLTPTGPTAAIEWTLNIPNGTVTSFSTAASPAAIAAGKSISCASAHCVLAGSSAPLPSGTVATVTLNVAPSAQGNVNIQLINPKAALSDGSLDTVSVVSGTLSITASTTIGVTVSPQTSTLGPGATQQFSATVTGTPNSSVIWSFSPAGAGSITTTGLYTAPATISTAQSVTVWATSVADNTKQASAVVTLQPQASVSIAVSPSAATLSAGGKAQFAATVSGSTNTAVTWSVSPAQAGSVTTTGLYTAPSTISTTQTVKVVATSVADVTKQASAVVTLQPQASVSIAVSPSTANLGAGGTAQFAATVNGTTNTAVTWSIAPAGVGSISTTGLYKAPSTISATQLVTVTAASAADATKLASAVVTLTPSQPPAFSPIRINCGGPSYVDPAGNAWAADNSSAGSTFAVTSAITNTTTPKLYQSERYSGSPLLYTFAAPNGTYTVNLKFAEIYFTSRGSRVFNILINGQTVQSSFDVFAAAGGAFRAIDKGYNVSVTNGAIAIQLVPLVNNAKIGAIEILAGAGAGPVGTPGMTPIRVNAGGNGLTDPTGTTWAADNGYTGGTSYSTTESIAGTSTPALYQTERWSSSTLKYQFAVPNGTRTVNLKFAEIYEKAASSRVFNIVINGQTVTSNFDIYAAAGGAYRAIDMPYQVAVVDGLVTIQLVPIVSNPKISALEIY